MEMRDRLIELLQNFADGTHSSNGHFVDNTQVDDVADHLLANGVIALDTGVISHKNRPLITHFAGMPMDDVLGLVRAKQESRIIVLPCEAEDVIYSTFNGEIKELKVISYSVLNSTAGNYQKIHTVNSRGAVVSYESHDFGKIVFLTKEEAEKALKESEGNG